MSYKTLATLADWVKVLALPAVYFSVFGGRLHGEAGAFLERASLVFLLVIAIAGAALTLLLKLNVMSLRCPDCRSPVSAFDRRTIPFSVCTGCNAAFWKKIVKFGYVRVRRGLPMEWFPEDEAHPPVVQGEEER
jgi:hypothetical protein